MRRRLIELIRIAAPILTLAAIALAGQAGQRWPNH
jgi:hypothetical protein